MQVLADDGLEPGNAILPEEGDGESESDIDWHVTIVSAPREPRFTDDFLRSPCSLECESLVAPLC